MFTYAHVKWFYGKSRTAIITMERIYIRISSVERKITELVTSTFISHELVTISSLNDVEVNSPVNVLIRRTL